MLRVILLGKEQISNWQLNVNTNRQKRALHKNASSVVLFIYMSVYN